VELKAPTEAKFREAQVDGKGMIAGIFVQ
jgi:hypothetical protein